MGWVHAQPGCIDLGVFSIIKRLSFFYNHLEEIILVILFAIMVGVIFLQIIMRYVFNNSLTWSEELGRFVFQWLTWIGISLGARLGQHIKISILTDRLPNKLAHAANVISDLVVIAICVITVYYGIEISKLFVGTKFTTIKISLAWGYSALVVGCGLMTIRSLISIKNSIRSMFSNEPPIGTGSCSVDMDTMEGGPN